MSTPISGTDALLMTWMPEDGGLRVRVGGIENEQRRNFGDLDLLDVDELAGLRDLLAMIGERVEELRVSKLVPRADDVRAQVAEQVPVAPLAVHGDVVDEQPADEPGEA